MNTRIASFVAFLALLPGTALLAADSYKNLENHVANLYKKHLIPGAGHWIQQERPKEINELLIDFLRSL